MSAARSLLLAVALLSLGASAPMIRYAAALPLAIIAWRTAFAWPLLAAVSLWRRERWPLRQAVPAGLCLALHWLAWISAVQLTSIARATILVASGALWCALLSRPLLGERLPRRLWVGIAIALAGVATVVAPDLASGGSHLAGDLCALGGALSWVAYTFVGRRARSQADFWGYTAAVYGVTGVAVLIVALASGTPLWGFSPATWLAIAALATFPTLLGHGTINYLLRRVGPAKLSLSILSKPVIAATLAWMLFAETPGPTTIAGGLATLVGIAVGTAPKLRWPRLRARAQPARAPGAIANGPTQGSRA